MPCARSRGRRSPALRRRGSGGGAGDGERGPAVRADAAGAALGADAELAEASCGGGRPLGASTCGLRASSSMDICATAQLLVAIRLEKPDRGTATGAGPGSSSNSSSDTRMRVDRAEDGWTAKLATYAKHQNIAAFRAISRSGGSVERGPGKRRLD